MNLEFIKKKVDGLSSNMGIVSSLASGVMERFVVGKIAKKFEERVEENKKKKVGKRR